MSITQALRTAAIVAALGMMGYAIAQLYQLAGNSIGGALGAL